MADAADELCLGTGENSLFSRAGLSDAGICDSV